MGCRIITANRRVDHSTLARFIRRHRAALKLLFVQVLAVCGSQQGLVNLAAVAVDGSPMEANASRDSNQRLQRLESIISDCEAEIDSMVDGSLELTRSCEAERATDADSDVAPNEWPRLSRLLDRPNRAVVARQRLFERALPSGGEIRLKGEAAERMVARAEKRLAAESEAHQKKLEAIALANSTPYGLAAGLQTSGLARAPRVAPHAWMPASSGSTTGPCCDPQCPSEASSSAAMDANPVRRCLQSLGRSPRRSTAAHGGMRHASARAPPPALFRRGSPRPAAS